MKPDLISFDADGTLVKRTLVDRFWYREVPKLYSEKHGLEPEEARRRVKEQYKKLGDQDVRWYLPDYWFERFDLQSDPRSVIEDISASAQIFEDASEILPVLSSELPLIVVSNASRPFLDVQLKPIEEYFRGIYSCVSDLVAVKKEPEVYLRICEWEEVDPEAVIHIGDDPKFDYRVPRQIGITSFLVDTERNFGQCKSRGLDCLQDLREIFSVLD